MRSISLFPIVLFLSQASFGQIIRVPADHPTIQAAIDSAVTGDTVLVSDGAYKENIRFRDKSITLASLFIINGDTSHISATVIDGSNPADPDSGSTVSFLSPGSNGSVLTGFTITGGTGTLVTLGSETIRAGGGVLCIKTDPRIENNRIVANEIKGGGEDAGGVGLAAFGDFPGFNLVVRNNVISRNVIDVSGSALGGGVMLNMGGILTENLISENLVRSANGIAVGPGVFATSLTNAGVSASIVNNQITRNRNETLNPDVLGAGGGIVVEAMRVVVRGNRIAENVMAAASAGAGIGVMLVSLPEDGSSVLDNVIVNNRCETGFCVGGGIVAADITGLHIDHNRISGNEAGIGGGIALSETFAEVRRNLIDHNVAEGEGGGLWIDNVFIAVSKGDGSIRPLLRASARLRALQSISYDLLEQSATAKADGKRVELVNNTIVDNRADGSLGGGGIFAAVASPSLQNSIVWGNEATDHAQIRGAVSATYSIVESGLVGEGNLDDDPLFTDRDTYHLADSSPAVDAGNPDPAYNDVEDTVRAGMPLAPALGALRNDMGATGGPKNAVVMGPLLGPRFSELIQRVNDAPPSEKQNLVDSFMVAIGSTPLIEENNVVYFLYRGAGNRITVPGDANGWRADAFPMTGVAGTNLWYREAVFEPDARLDYKITVDGNWIVDPENPRTVVGGFGPNSELAMPEFEHPDEIDQAPGTPQGSLATINITSNILSNSRVMQVYTPASYNAAPADSFPVIYFHDGSDYTNLANAKVVLDNLIARERIVPIIAVFVTPVDRNNEYAFTKTKQYERFVIEEAMPLIDSEFRTMKRPEMRAMSGPSFGGLITTQICYNKPDVFGLCAVISPSYWANDREVFDMVVDGPVKPIAWYVDWGSYELEIADGATAFVQALEEKGTSKGASDGYEVTWNEWHDGHSWGNWRAHMKEFLILFFPGRRATSLDDQAIPSDFGLQQNYPNPFSDGVGTNLGFSIPSPARVSLRIFDVMGRLVAELADADFPQGKHEIHWNATGMAAGVYVYRLDSPGYSETRTLVILK
ncbi:MAG: alpha/beta hydrolase-fold protein [Rhodothermia bacterium]